MKITSWNVNSLKVRLDQVLDWIDLNQPDVIGLQETKLKDENFPEKAIQEAGYHAAFTGQATYNGVALLSREPAEDVRTDIPGFDDPHRRVIAGTFDGVRVTKWASIVPPVPYGEHFKCTHTDLVFAPGSTNDPKPSC